jgi:hypothetical protein
MAKNENANVLDTARDRAIAGGEAARRSAKGGKSGGGLGGQKAGGIKGGARRKTHAGAKKGSPSVASD